MRCGLITDCCHARMYTIEVRHSESSHVPRKSTHQCHIVWVRRCMIHVQEFSDLMYRIFYM